MPTKNLAHISTPPNADNPEQSRRFVDMARKVEVDETPGALDQVIKKIIKPPRRPENDV